MPKHIFISTECTAVDNVVARNQAKALALQKPVREVESRQEQEKMYRKRLTRKQADKYDPELFADVKEQAPMPTVPPMTDNGKGQYRLEDVFAGARNGERR